MVGGMGVWSLCQGFLEDDEEMEKVANDSAQSE